MPPLFLHALHTDDALGEEPAATRDRLKGKYPPGATRRMTQLGLILGTTLHPLAPRETDTLVYASEYGESRALENYLDSFPTPSPTLFQTSIHPSAVQQALIGRQQPIQQFFPLTGRDHLVASALTTALLADTPRVILCGGEERATWLTAHRIASSRTFAFACLLTRDPTGSLARLTLTPEPPPPPSDRSVPSASGPQLSTLDSQLAASPRATLPAFFDALHARHPLDLFAAPGLHLNLSWS